MMIGMILDIGYWMLDRIRSMLQIRLASVYPASGIRNPASVAVYLRLPLKSKNVSA
jgi:hypothetical protein